ADEIVASAQRVIDHLGEATDPEALRAIVDNARRGTANLAEASRRVAGLVDNANALVVDLRSIVHGNESAVQATTTDLRQASRSFKELARELREHPSRLLFSRSEPDRKLP